MLGRKLRRPEEPEPQPQPPPLPPTRCTESFDGPRPHVGGAGHRTRVRAVPCSPAAPAPSPHRGLEPLHGSNHGQAHYCASSVLRSLRFNFI